MHSCTSPRMSTVMPTPLVDTPGHKLSGSALSLCGHAQSTHQSKGGGLYYAAGWYLALRIVTARRQT